MAVIEPLSIELGVQPRTVEPLTSPPAAGPRAVLRSALLGRLCATAGVPVAAIVAPAGYGKTTLLAQWTERDPRPSVWITLAGEHDDPDAVESLLADVVEEPDLLVVVDDVHVLRSGTAVDALRGLLSRVPFGSTVALAGRLEPARLLSRLRVEGRVLELGADDLALTGRDAQTLLRRAGVLLPESDALAVEQRTEGWPAALSLAALALRAGVPASAFAGDDCFVADYLETEHLSELSPAQRRFAMHTSVLDELSADSCDALLERPGAGRTLEALERKGVVVPLDHRRRLYRYRRLVRDVLRAELERLEPERARALHRTAAAWSEDHGAPEQALRHAVAAGDLEHAGELAPSVVLPACARGRLAAAESVLELLGDVPGVERHSDVCIAGSWVHALRGRPAESQLWADHAARGLRSGDPRLHVLHALRCRDGAEQMLDDAAAACSALPPGSVWRPAATLARGAARLLAGDPAGADRDLGDVVESATAAGAGDLVVAGLCLRALAAAERDSLDEAERLVDEALVIAETTRPDPSAIQLLLHAVSARMAIRNCDRGRALEAVARAEELMPFLTYAAPWLSSSAALELVRVQLALADAERARDLLRRVADIHRVRPRLGTLVQLTAELDRRALALAEPEGRWASSLTPAEQRLLPMLATHLSFREIGERLFVSRNTVKTQAISIYRKFGVSSRSDAIERAVELGLIEDTNGTARGVA